MTWKDIIYLLSFAIGLFTFIKTFRKKDYCSIDYKTEEGDEVNLYIFGIKDDLYNLQIVNNDPNINATKLNGINISQIKYKRADLEDSGDESLYFPFIDKNDFIEIKNANKLGPIQFKYQDKYSNKYSQTIEFDMTVDKSSISRRYYKISKRRAHPLWKRII